VTIRGVFPIWSFIISCHIKICSGYARASPYRTKEITGSFPLSQLFASFVGTKFGLSMEGIPSFGGPPELNSESSMERFSVFVFHSPPGRSLVL